MKTRFLFILGASGAILFLAATADAALITNRWTNSVSGKWETPSNWSLGVAPTNSNAAVLITNATTKTVTIDATTVLSNAFIGCLTISNLLVSGPAGTVDTLTNVAATTPLHILNSFTITSGGNLVCGPGGDIRVDNDLDIASTVVVSNGVLMATNASATTAIGNSGGPGQVFVNGASSTLDLDAFAIGVGDNGTLTLSAGSVMLRGPNSSRIGNTAGQTGTVWVTGGQLLITNSLLRLPFLAGAVGRMTVSNGTVLAQDVNVGENATSLGTLTVVGGTNAVSSSMILGNIACTSSGTVIVAGGRLFVTNSTASAVLDVRSGSVTLNSGTLTINNLVMSNACGHFLKTGGNLSITSTNIDGSLDADGDGLPNSWETGFGFDPFADSSSDDPDGDVFTNLQEYNAGTNPNSAGSNPNINSWTNSVSGKWEIGVNWVLTVPPASNQSVFVTNSTTKTVTIDATTTNTPGAMTVSNLTVRGIGAGINTLQLTNAGAATPLRILNGFTLGTNAVLVVTNSVLQVDGLSGAQFDVDGTVTNLAGGQIVTTNVLMTIGNTATSRGNLTTSGGLLLASDISVGLVGGSQSTLMLAGGTNTLSSSLTVGVSAHATGAVWVTGGRLVVTNDSTFIGNSGVGQMTVSNGTWLAEFVRVSADATSQGTLTVAGGTSALNGLAVGDGTGTVRVTGGLLVVTNRPDLVGAGSGFIIDGSVTVTNGGSIIANTVNITIGNRGSGSLTMDGGSLSAFDVFIGENAGAQGTLTVVGDASAAVGILEVGASFNATGIVWMTSGQLSVGGGRVGYAGVGQMTVSNGSWRSSSLSVGSLAGSQGTLTIAGGTNMVPDSLSVGVFASATGVVWVTGGRLVVTNGTEVGGFGIGQMTVSNGTWLSDNAVFVGRSPGSRGTLTVAGGVTTVASNMIVGSFGCNSTGVVTVTAGSLHITNSLGTAVLEVRSGTFTLNSGTVVVNKIVITNSCANFVRSGGTLIYSNAVLNAASDDDGDGLPNGWEQSYGLDPLDSSGSNGATGDSDGDGRSNAQEFADDTSPLVSDRFNSWTNAASGFWQESNRWSTVHAPSTANEAVFVTNTTTKTVTIDATTTTTTSAMTISNLTLSGPSGSINTLQLTNAGTVTPLRILRNFALGTNAVLVVTNSALRVDGLSGGSFSVDGSVTNLTDGQIIVTNASMIIGNTAKSRGNFTTSGGLLLARDIVVGDMGGSEGTLAVAGGTNTLSSSLTLGSFANATGAVWVTGGQLTVTNGSTFVGSDGVGQMTVSNGTWRAGYVSIGDGSQGTLTIAGGTSTLSEAVIGGGFSGVPTGTVWVTGGQLTVNDYMFVGGIGVGRMTVSNGMWRVEGGSSVSVVGFGVSPGTLTVAGGTSTLAGILYIGGYITGEMEEPAEGDGTVWLTGGQLTVTNDYTFIGLSGIGQMTVSNGTWLAETVYIGSSSNSFASLTIAGGTNTLSSSLIIGNSGTGTVWVTGGQLTATNDSTIIGDFYDSSGQMTVSNGTWLTKSVVVGHNDRSQGTLTVAGGTSIVFSNLTIGDFPCTSTGTVVIAGGNLFVTNATANAVLEVRSGSLILNSGTLTVDMLVMTNACGQFVHTGGTLVYGTAVLDPARDDDGDGLPNGWEQSYGLDPLNPSGNNGASGDFDGDGFTNLQEFNAGTNPANSASVPPNSWINPSSGKWETGANWVLTIPPGSNQAVFVTNSTTKTVTIDATTTNTASAMTISNLTLSGPSGSINTLQLTNAGTATPLRILRNFTLGTNAVLVVTNSVLQVDGSSGGGFTDDGTATLREGGQITASNLVAGSVAGATGTVWVTGGQLTTTNSNTSIGLSGTGQMTVSNGTVLGSSAVVGDSAGSQGTLTIAGGTSQLTSFLAVGSVANATGVVWVTGGQLAVAANTVIGSLGVGQLTMSNGTVMATNEFVGSQLGSKGTLTMAGGTNVLSGALTVGNNLNATGTVWMTDGQLVVTNNVTFIGFSGVGQMTVSNGTWLARNVNVAPNAGSRGTLTVAGGSSTVSSNLTVGRFTCNSTGIVSVVSGELDVTNATGSAVLEVRSGSLILNSGLLTVDKLVMTNACGSFVHTGGTLIYGTAVLTSTRDDDGDGLPNGWEQSYGLDPLDPSGNNGAAADPDGDGFTNLQEFQAGTDPTNNTSAFRITAIARVASTNILVTWTMGPDKTNALQRAAGTANGSYSNNFADIFTVTNTVAPSTNYLDVGAASAGNTSRFYRVRLVP